MRSAFVFLFLSPALVIFGCSHSSNPLDPLSPSGPHEIVSSSPDTNLLPLGFYDISISADHKSAEITPLRTADMHLNAVRLLEVTPCNNCLTISDLVKLTPSHLQAKLTLKHPFPGLLKYTAFDVRGIFISGADFTFPESGRLMAMGNTIPMLINPDGYTSLFNPTEFPESSPGPAALKYIPGKNATGGDLSATLNPYVAYNQDKPRCIFAAGTSSSRTVLLYVPPGPIHFGYAVLGCWQPVGKPITDPLKDFPSSANCTEAYKISVSIGDGLDVSTGGSAEISVQVYDHQGLDTISSVTVESPDLFSGVLPLTYKNATGVDNWLFTGTIKNDKSAGGSTYPILIRVIDSDLDPNLGLVGAWQVTSVALKSPIGNGWARTWGGIIEDRSYDAAVDSSGNIYVVGFFSDNVDFGGGDIHTSIGGCDAYLSKFTSSGQHLWTRTWGGLSTDYAAAVAVDSSDFVYVAGYFTGEVDFDPGDGVDNQQSESGSGFFLSCFDSSGKYQWARIMPGSSYLWPCGLAVDPNGLTVSGRFENSGDFDPGPGSDIHTSAGSGDPFISRFDHLGNWQWTRTWEGTYEDAGLGVAADTSGNVYGTGYFGGTVDFDPGPGTDMHTANGPSDSYLLKLDSSGIFQWALNWGGDVGSGYDDYGIAVAANNSCVWVTGLYSGTGDFDPGPGVDNHTSVGIQDSFVSKFDSQGIFQWARTWGSTDYDASASGDIDSAGNVYLCGWFSGLSDFDPGTGLDNHDTQGGTDSYVSKFDPQGNFLWARTWGGASSDWGLGIGVSTSGNAFCLGMFSDTVDFNPGPGTDLHQSNGGIDAFLVKFPPSGNW